MNTKNIILFDMDNTLVSADTMDLWSLFLEEKGIVKETEKQLRIKFNHDYHERKLDVVEYFKFETSLINHIPLPLRQTWRENFFNDFVKPKISRTGLRLIQEYKKNPDNMIILITATLSFIAQPVAFYAGVRDLIATEVEIHDEVYTGNIVGLSSLGEGKVERFKLWLEENQISPAYTILYSDSINDLPLFNFVHKPVVTDPDKYLAAIACEKNWECISLIDSDRHTKNIRVCQMIE